jgi:Ca2+-binding RTX toxin-like protein
MAIYYLGAPAQGDAWTFGPHIRNVLVEAAPNHMLIRWEFGGGITEDQHFYGSFTYSGEFSQRGFMIAHGRLDETFVAHNDGFGSGIVRVHYKDLNVDMDLVAQYDDYWDDFMPILFAGDDVMTSERFSDKLAGYAGNDTLWGGEGNDTLDGGAGLNLLRGEDGNDLLQGGAGFDDINGNAGDDRAFGGPGGDWVVGGKDNDELYGDGAPWDYDGEGADIVLGNLGDDTLDGGGADDQVRGGQGDDLIVGGAGADWLSGDRGSDTLTGGAGADVFHSFGEAGLDRVTDFRRAEGDRVLLDPGSSWSAAQSGSDTVIAILGGAQVVLVGVSLSSLGDGWISAV